MDIDKISSIGRIGKIEGGNATKGRERIIREEKDTLSISAQGKKAQELDYLKSLIFNAISNLPERIEKIEIAASRIREGYYDEHIADIALSLLNPPS